MAEVSKLVIGGTPYDIKDATARQMISEMTGIKFAIVTSLPTTGVMGTIYLVAHSHGTSDGYDEYIWITVGTTSKWEKIGSTDIDLSGYWSKAEMTKLSNDDIDTILV